MVTVKDRIGRMGGSFGARVKPNERAGLMKAGEHLTNSDSRSRDGVANETSIGPIRNSVEDAGSEFVEMSSLLNVSKVLVGLPQI